MSLATELQAQLDYAALRNDAYTTYGKKLPKTRRAYARQLQNKIRKSQLDDLKPRLRYAANGKPIYSSIADDRRSDPANVSATKVIDPAMFTNAAAIAQRGAYRRRRKRGRGMYYGGAYYANQVAGRGSFWNQGLKAARKGASWVRKHQHNIKAVGMAINPEATMATDAFLKRTGAGKAAARMLGRGAYNSLFPLETAGQLVEFDQVSSEHGNLIVKGQEKIADIFGNEFVSGSTTDCVPFTSFTINCTPGNFQQFPKLAQHAANFKEYEWISLIFTYKSTLPQNWQTTDVTTGKVIMATEYNLKKPVWTTHGELAAQEQKVEGPVTGITKDDRVHTLGVECDPRMMTTRALKFVRTKGLTPDEEQQDYDLARVSFGLFGTNAALANQMIGELHVTYEVHFKTHRQYTMLGYNIPESITYNNFGNGITWAADGATAPSSVTAGTDMTLGTGIWDQLFNFNQEGISRSLCYNNISYLLTPKLHRWIPTGSSRTYDGIALEFVFPSSLKGNYEIEIELTGDRLIPNDESVEDELVSNGHNYGLVVKSPVINPTVSGTALLNYDFPSERNAEQDCVNVTTGMKKWTIKCHVHLEQATSVSDNALKLLVPMVMQTTSLVTNIENYSGDGKGAPYYYSTKVSIRQYNAFQQLGQAGHPYIDTVTKALVTK